MHRKSWCLHIRRWYLHMEKQDRSPSNKFSWSILHDCYCIHAVTTSVCLLSRWWAVVPGLKERWRISRKGFCPSGRGRQYVDIDRRRLREDVCGQTEPDHSVHDGQTEDQRQHGTRHETRETHEKDELKVKTVTMISIRRIRKSSRLCEGSPQHNHTNPDKHVMVNSAWHALMTETLLLNHNTGWSSVVHSNEARQQWWQIWIIMQLNWSIRRHVSFSNVTLCSSRCR